MKEAVEYLSKKDETYQHCGASYIQHNTFVDDKAKEEVGVFYIIWVPCVTGALNCENLLVNRDVNFKGLGSQHANLHTNEPVSLPLKVHLLNLKPWFGRKQLLEQDQRLYWHKGWSEDFNWDLLQRINWGFQLRHTRV